MVPAPTNCVPNPTTIPESPIKETTLFSSVVKVGSPTITDGGVVYPIPPLITVIWDMVPPTLIVAAASAVVIVPIPAPTVLAMLTPGVVE